MPLPKVLDNRDADIRHAIARSLAAISRAYRVSRLELADIAGCSHQTISNAMNERFTLTAVPIARLSMAYPEFRWMPPIDPDVIAIRDKAQAKARAQGELRYGTPGKLRLAA